LLAKRLVLYAFGREIVMIIQSDFTNRPYTLIVAKFFHTFQCGFRCCQSIVWMNSHAADDTRVRVRKRENAVEPLRLNSGDNDMRQTSIERPLGSGGAVVVELFVV